MTFFGNQKNVTQEKKGPSVRFYGTSLLSEGNSCPMIAWPVSSFPRQFPSFLRNVSRIVAVGGYAYGQGGYGKFSCISLAVEGFDETIIAVGPVIQGRYDLIECAEDFELTFPLPYRRTL